jgi:Ca-activated chloride channel homolog
MPLTTPLALLGLLFVPAVVAMYLLKLRREERPVASTLL